MLWGHNGLYMVVQERKRIAMAPAPLILRTRKYKYFSCQDTFLVPIVACVCVFHAFAKGSSKKRRRRRIKLQRRQLLRISAVEHTLTGLWPSLTWLTS